MASNKARHKKFTVTEKFIHSSLCFAFSMSHLCRHKRGNCLGPCGCAVVLLSPDPVPTSAKARKVSEPRTLIYPSSYSSSSKWSALLPPADESLAVLVDCAVAAGRTLRRRTGNRPPVATPRRGGGRSFSVDSREGSLTEWSLPPDHPEHESNSSEDRNSGNRGSRSMLGRAPDGAGGEPGPTFPPVAELPGGDDRRITVSLPYCDHDRSILGSTIMIVDLSSTR